MRVRVGGEGRKFRGSFELADTDHVLTDSIADAQIVPREPPVLPVLPWVVRPDLRWRHRLDGFTKVSR